MPANPIQRRTRNSFLLGMLVMLIIAVAIIAILYFTAFGEMITEVKDKGQGGTVVAYKLTADVKSGETIKLTKVEAVNFFTTDLPSDYMPTSEDISRYKSKVDLKAGTVLSRGLLYQEEMVANSTRLMEYNMLTLPSTLRIGDYVDVRLTLPTGQDFIVVSKKQIMSVKDTTVGFYLTEDEILMMSSAIIESYIIKASNLHVTQYVEAGLQDSATPTYAVNSQVYALVQADYQNKNKVDKDGKTLNNIEDYSKINTTSEHSELRTTIEQALGLYANAGEDKTNLEERMDEQKSTSMELYLSGLMGY